MNPNPNLELVYNGLVKHKLIDTSGGYDYNKFESWINENPSNLNTIYDGMVKNNLIDTKDGSYTFDNFSKWIGNVDVNKEQHLEETKEQTPATKALYNMLESKWLFGGLNQDKKEILNYVGKDPGETIDLSKLSVGGISTITAHNTLTGLVGHGLSMATATVEGTYDYLKNEKNRGTIAGNAADVFTGDDAMRKYIQDVREKGLEDDQSPISTILEMMNDGTPEEKQSKAKLQLAQNPGLMGTHTILKYLINGLAIPATSALIKDTDLSPYYNNEHAKYIEHLTSQAKIDNVDTESFKDKGISAFMDPNFLATEFADGVGFFGAALLQGGVTKMGTNAVLGPITKGVAYSTSGLTKVIKPTSSLAKFDKAYGIAKGVTDKVDLATGVTVMSIGEAAMEAQNLELSLRPQLEEKYGKLVESGELTPEEASQQIEAQLNEGQRETFISNMGLLLFTNGIELAGVMRSFKPKGAGKYLPEDQSLFQRGKSIVKTGASEAAEENLQAAIGSFEENKRIYDKYDDYGINITRILGEGVEGVTDPAVQRAMLIGFGLGGATQTVSEFNDYKKVKKYYNEIQPQQLKDAQILGLNSIKGLYSVDTDGKIVIDEVAKKNFMKSYLDHKNDISFLEDAIESNNADLIDFAHNNLLSKFVQRSIEGGADVATTLAGVESVLNAKYDPTLNKSQIQEMDSDGSVISFEEFKAKKLKIAERAVATHQHVEKISKSKDITDIKHKADLFDSYNKYQFLNDKIEQLESQKNKIDDIELDANKEMVTKLDNRINKLKVLSVLYGARINDLTRDSSIKSRKIQSTIENIKMNSKDEAELKANLQSAVTEGMLSQSDVDKALKVEEIPPFDRPKDDQVIDQEDQEETEKERKQLFQLKKTELQDKYGVEIYDNLDGTFETIKPIADTEEAILNAQKATEELEKLGFKQKIRTPEEISEQPVDQGLIDIDEISNPEDIDNVEETESTDIQTKKADIERRRQEDLETTKNIGEDKLKEGRENTKKIVEFLKQRYLATSVQGIIIRILEKLIDFSKYSVIIDSDYLNNRNASGQATWFGMIISQETLDGILEGKEFEVHTFIHEFIHGFTTSKISDYNIEKKGLIPGFKSNLTAKEKNAIEQLQRIFEKVKRDNPNSKEYGFTNLDEFIAEAFSNSSFQYTLKNTKTEGKKSNLFSEFINAIGDLLFEQLERWAKRFNKEIPQRNTITGILEDVLAWTEDLINQNNKLAYIATNEEINAKYDAELKKRVPEVVERYTDDDVKANPDKIFVFGDNVQRTGTGGQAQIRNNPNAFGIATKLKPSNRVDAFMSDNDLENNKKIIDSDIQKILDQNKPLVFPKDGFGTGLAKLKEKAPRTYEYLKQRLAEEFLFNNDTGEIISETEENQEEKETPKTKNPQQKPNDEAFTDSKKRDLENKVNELQDEINEGDAPNAIIEYLRSSEVWNKLAYLTRSFRQFFRVGEDSFSVTRQDFDNFVRDEIRPILNPNEYKPGKQLKVVVRDDDSMEMYIPGDVEKETTTWGKIKEQLKDGPIIGFYGEQYTYDDLVPLAILDENGNEVPLNIHITSWVTEFNVSENEEITIQDNIVKLRELRSSILANPKSLTSGVGIQITDRSNGVLFFIKDENGNNESSVLSEVAEDIDLVTFTGGTFKGTINTNKLEVSNTFHENAALGATYFIYQLNVNEKGEPVYSKAPVLNRKLSNTHKKSIKTAIEIFATGKTHEHYTLFKNAGYDLSTVKGLESYLSNFIRLTFVPKSFKTFGAYMKSLDSDHFAIHISPNGQVEFGSKVKTKSTYYLKSDAKAILQTLDNTLDNLYFNVNVDLLQNSIGGNIKLPLMDDTGFKVVTTNYATLVRENVDTQVMPLKVGELNKKTVYVATIQPKLSFSLESENTQITELETIEENMNQSELEDTLDNIDDIDSIDGLDIPNVGYENDITNPCI